MAASAMGSMSEELRAAVSAVRRQKVELILVADDDPASLELVRTVLEESGCTVCGVADGAAAVRSARMILPDLIILDLEMPGLDGLNVLRELRSDRRFDRTPVLALTASAMDGDGDRILAAGFTAYLPKPAGVQTLRSEVACLLRTVQAKKSLPGTDVEHRVERSLSR